MRTELVVNNNQLLIRIHIPYSFTTKMHCVTHLGREKLNRKGKSVFLPLNICRLHSSMLLLLLLWQTFILKEMAKKTCLPYLSTLNRSTTPDKSRLRNVQQSTGPIFLKLLRLSKAKLSETTTSVEHKEL